MTAEIRPVALVVGTWRDATPEDHKRMDLILTRLLERGWAPLFYPRAFLAPPRAILGVPGVPMPPLLDDTKRDQRAVALECSQAMVRALAQSRHPVDMFVDRHGASEGMWLDIAEWARATGGTPVYDAPTGEGWEARLDTHWMRTCAGLDRPQPRQRGGP